MDGPRAPQSERNVPRRALHGKPDTQSRPPPPPDAPKSSRYNTLGQPRITPGDRVYTNRNLDMAQVDWLGFDMDYTLAIYNQAAMDELSVELTVENLIEQGYPEYLRDNRYDFRFPIRGLLIDRQLGHVLKMNRFNGIHKGYHGYRRLTKEELNAEYWDKKVKPNSNRFHWIDTLFGLSEVTAYVSILESLEAEGEQVDFGRLFQDIREAIDLAHARGDVHRRVLKNLPAYVDRDPHLAPALHKLRSSGKKLFLLTNSPIGYTEGMMKYLLDDAIPGYRSWRHYFDVVVVSARKPSFFDGDQEFREVAADGTLAEEPQRLERGKAYSGGNLKAFERLTGVKSSTVLYVGDHIYGDILRSKKESVWRTAMIIQELDAELAAHHSCGPALAEKLSLHQRREILEDERRFSQMHYKELTKKNGDISAAEARRLADLKRDLERLKADLKTIDLQTDTLERTIDEAFHPYWGSLLKEHGEMSSFGAQVGRYGDIYMRRVSCLRHYAPTQFFRSPHDFMPHEL